MLAAYFGADPTIDKTNALRAVADAAVAADRAGIGEPVGEVVTVGGYPDDSEHRVKWLVKFKELKNGDLLYTRPHHAEDKLEMVMPDDVGLTVDEANLLEALKLLLDQVEHGDDEVWVLNKVRAVIRKCEAKKAGAGK